MPHPRLSVILPTHDRASSLGQAVDALLRQNAPPDIWEILLVAPGTLDVAPDPLACTVAVRVAPVPEPCGDILAFTATDVEVAPDWVWTLITTLDARPDVDGLCGRVLPAWPQKRPAWVKRSDWGALALQDHGDQKRVFDRCTPAALVASNLAFRRTALDRLGLFLPDTPDAKPLRPVDVQGLVARLYAAGGRVLYSPRLLALARVQPERLRLFEGFAAHHTRRAS